MSSLALALAIAMFLLAGCHRQPDASTELANTVRLLEQSTPSVSAAAGGPPARAARALPAQEVKQALVSLQAGNYPAAIAQMESARSNPQKTPQQTIAIQDALAAVMNDLYNRAAAGDAAAKQAIRQYQQNRNNP